MNNALQLLKRLTSNPYAGMEPRQDKWWCEHCHSIGRDPETIHDADCPVVVARQLVADSEKARTPKFSYTGPAGAITAWHGDTRLGTIYEYDGPGDCEVATDPDTGPHTTRRLAAEALLRKWQQSQVAGEEKPLDERADS